MNPEHLLRVHLLIQGYQLIRIDPIIAATSGSSGRSL